MNTDRGERGSALLTALVVVVLLGAAFTLLAGMLVHRMERTQEGARRTELTALVDAAMAETLAHLASSSVYPGVAEHDLGRGTIRSDVHHGAGGAYIILARAELHGATMAVEARGHTTPTGPRVTSWRRLRTADDAPGRTGRMRPPVR